MKNERDILVLPLIPIRGLTVFPGMVTHFDVGREKSIKALENAMMEEQIVMLSTQKDEEIELPTIQDLYKIGTVVKVKQMLKMQGDLMRVLVEGMDRAEIKKAIKETPFFEAEIEIKKPTENAPKTTLEALKRNILRSYERYMQLTNRVSPDAMHAVSSITEKSRFADAIVSNMHLKTAVKQELLSTIDVAERFDRLYTLLEEEISILGVERDLSEKVQDKLNQNQKEYYLREQLKVIRSELGDSEDDEREVEEFREKLAKLNLSPEITKKVTAEIDRYSRAHSSSPESDGIRNYLKLFFDLPWNNYSEDLLDMPKTRQILDEDHYGLKDVKERIVEHLAIRQMTEDYKGSIVCLVGPPGVGKTSIAKSIARSMNRKFVRMSLGGVRDEAEIRGHRRTYIGSMPGRIISAMKEAGVMNPVFLFDEIDKLASDFRGDPASALLEVLDKNQNNTFVDRYLEVPFDLSKVMFITTANTLSTIPRPLMDRMEIIELSGYTRLEKQEIAFRHLIKNQLKEHGLKPAMLKFSKPAVQKIISNYTREAGVRQLERTIGKVCRKVTCEIVENKKKSVSITPKNVKDYLGVPRRDDDALPKTNQVGVVTGLAWTSVGGETLVIEVSAFNGTGKIQLTGNMGDVMKESAAASISYVRARSRELGIDPYFYKNKDIHLHIPEGAVPKDGPSAGITMATALASCLSGIPVDRTVSMTGEITLRGRVLQIGGLKEKLLAAMMYGIKTVIIPESNEKDLEEIPDEIKDNLKIIPVKHMDQVIDIAFERKPKKLTDADLKKLETREKAKIENKKQ